MGDSPGVRVLFVDDDDTVRRLVGTILKHLRMAATVVASPSEALWQITENAGEFDLLVTDLSMPEMSGDRLFGRVQDLAPALPVMIVSGDTCDPRIKACLQRGARGFLAKPFTVAQFAEAIYHACGSTRLRT